ncbi:Lsr2 family protein [Cryobacterium sp. Hh7]|uniref:histone-like nucleoid-structuring protein Lsr2 n=1 Tax=unclassified Cryobacterium TaxID=2649013 RepID=UPI00106B8D1A|nr:MULTISPECIES: Lsr2 family protein [unclassified Cryobacterium]TFD51913.1 Lsr2 family protein [Cryobacterium sp. Hh11]TFD60711.1 Lsr2 family protein [Cryobacterium sp. Hh7]
MKKTTVQLLDDLDGSVIENGSGASVSFAFEGDSYEVDLSEKNLAEFRAALKPYADVARRVGYVPAKARAASGSKSDRAELQAVRAWASANGIQVSDRGRIAATVREAYSRAQAN